MKYSVGYQMREDYEFLNLIIEQKEKIHEVYFSWGDFANGRNNQTRQMGLTPWEAMRRQETDLLMLAKEGLSFNLLFNATCYGKDSQSRAFYNRVGETVAYIQEHFGLKSITTTSPLIARFVHDNFEDIDVRSSVNMSIGTIEGMEYVADWFDSFYVKRECNRDLGKIKELKSWCDANGKTLYALANSGCLNHCSAHVFHDNLVSHESEIAAMDNGYVFEGVCGKFLKDPDHFHGLLDYTSYIRPEDVDVYEGLVPALKLATRVSLYPERILKVYLTNHSYRGSMLDLLEPNHTNVLYPWLLENAKIKTKIENEKLVYYNLEEALIKLPDLS